jgi:hypothetical protein
MAGVALDTRTIFSILLGVTIVLGGLYILNPTFVQRLFGRREGFQDAPMGATEMNAGVPSTLSADSHNKANEAAMDVPGALQKKKEEENPNAALTNNEGFADLSTYEGPSDFGAAQPPAGCYPRDQLTPSELLPKDPNSVWAQQNPMGTGSLKGKNFLSAGALIGVNTVGQSLRNANYQIRSEPPNPQVPVSVFNQTTIEPDVNRRTLEIA